MIYLGISSDKYFRQVLNGRKKIKIILKQSKVSSISVSQRLNKITIYYFAEETLEIINAEKKKSLSRPCYAKEISGNKRN